MWAGLAIFVVPCGPARQRCDVDSLCEAIGAPVGADWLHPEMPTAIGVVFAFQDRTLYWQGSRPERGRLTVD